MLQTPNSQLQTPGLGPTRRGFTLVEMIVSLAIFSVVAVVAIGALLKVIDANKKAQSIQSSVTNINFALESMSRELRTGTNIQCANSFSATANLGSAYVIPCAIGQNPFIAFYSTRSNPADNMCAHGLITAYAFTGISPNITLQKAEQSSCSDPNYSFNDLVSTADMSITDYELGVLYDSNSNSNAHYPMVFIHIAGYAGTREKDKTYVDFETAVSARGQQ